MNHSTEYLSAVALTIPELADMAAQKRMPVSDLVYIQKQVEANMATLAQKHEAATGKMLSVAYKVEYMSTMAYRAVEVLESARTKGFVPSANTEKLRRDLSDAFSRLDPSTSPLFNPEMAKLRADAANLSTTQYPNRGTEAILLSIERGAALLNKFEKDLKDMDGLFSEAGTFNKITFFSDLQKHKEKVMDIFSRKVTNLRRVAALCKNFSKEAARSPSLAGVEMYAVTLGKRINDKLNHDWVQELDFLHEKHDFVGSKTPAL